MINTKEMVGKLISDVDIISLYENAIDSTCNDNLYMLSLYLRVRAFFYANDRATEFWSSSKNTTKKKAL